MDHNVLLTVYIIYNEQTEKKKKERPDSFNLFLFIPLVEKPKQLLMNIIKTTVGENSDHVTRSGLLRKRSEDRSSIRKIFS
ncbi:hypothetical protein VT98_11591, partial [Candidatus Electrothrix communis]